MCFLLVLDIMFLTCSRYRDIRTIHKIFVKNFYFLLQLEPYALNCYYRDGSPLGWFRLVICFVFFLAFLILRGPRA